jgi:hypothetical protein
MNLVDYNTEEQSLLMIALSASTQGYAECHEMGYLFEDEQ